MQLTGGSGMKIITAMILNPREWIKLLRKKLKRVKKAPEPKSEKLQS